MNVFRWQTAFRKRLRRGALAQPSVPETGRRLQDYYPLPALRQRVHYLFAHCFLPAVVHGNPGYFFDSLTIAERTEVGLSATLVQGLWNLMEETYGLVRKQASLEEDMKTPLRRVRDLQTWLQPVADRLGLIIQMPPFPEADDNAIRVQSLPLAWLIGTVLLGRSRARYFTLEQPVCPNGMVPEEKGPGRLCEWKGDGRHFPHEIPVAPDRESFTAAIAAKISG
jgi:hypothetical protein